MEKAAAANQKAGTDWRASSPSATLSAGRWRSCQKWCETTIEAGPTMSEPWRETRLPLGGFQILGQPKICTKNAKIH